MDQERALFTVINSRLSIAARLALIVAVFVLPIGVLTSAFVGQCYKDISFTQKEIAGSRYLGEIWQPLMKTAMADDMAPIRISDAGTFNTLFNTEDIFAEFANSLNPEARIAAGKALIAAIADRSNLTLDPDLDSFYTMDAVTVRLPGVVVAARSARNAIRVSRAPAGQSILPLAFAIERIRTAADQADASLRSAIRENRAGTLAGVLTTHVDALKTAIATFIDRGTARIENQTLLGDADDFVTLMVHIDFTWQKANAELLQLLLARIDHLTFRMGTGLAFAGICLAAALILAYAMSQGLSRRLSALLSVMDRLIENDTRVDVPFLADRNETGRIAKTLAAFKESLDKLSVLANRDGLTQLANRSAFYAAVAQASGRLKPSDRLAIHYLDLDRFKLVNDTMGHSTGDALLRAVSVRLQELCPKGSVICRLGGDEFAILQTTLGDDNAAEALASRIVEALSRPFQIGGRQINVSTSVGIAFGPTDGLDAETLLRNADLGLYKAKMEGRARWRVFEADMALKVLERQRLELDLRRAVNAGEFVLHYQPLLDARSEKVVAFEALIRWVHPERGMVPPCDFIAVAEETGLINPLGEWVIRQACMDASQWPSDIRVAVNLSPVQFKQPGLPQQIGEALARSGLAADRLEVEITESIFLGGDAETKAAVEDVRKMGVRIALDDFGVGYSSLGYLRTFRFDKIKIDRSFIHELGTTKEADAIVKAVSGLGISLGIATTAEGVETMEQWLRVRAQGFSEVQGYYFGRPLPIREALGILQSRLVEPAQRDEDVAVPDVLLRKAAG